MNIVERALALVTFAVIMAVAAVLILPMAALFLSEAPALAVLFGAIFAYIVAREALA